MAAHALRVCLQPGCGTLVESGRCTTHALPERDRGTRQERGYTAEFYRIVDELIKAGYGCAWAHLGGCKGTLTGDHILPLSKGGKTERGNVRLLCLHHNSARGNAKGGREGAAMRRGNG